MINLLLCFVVIVLLIINRAVLIELTVTWVPPIKTPFSLRRGPRTLGALIKTTRVRLAERTFCRWPWAARVAGEATVIPRFMRVPTRADPFMPGCFITFIKFDPNFLGGAGTASKFSGLKSLMTTPLATFNSLRCEL